MTWAWAEKGTVENGNGAGSVQCRATNAFGKFQDMKFWESSAGVGSLRRASSAY